MAGENENSIGTARAYLDIDTTDWDSAVARAKNSASGLGSAAEQAFDQATGAQKRAATQLLQYVTVQGQASDAQKVLNALMKGVPVDIAIAAANALQKQRDATDAATESQKKLNDEIAKQAAIDNARSAQNAQNAQQQFNDLLGVKPQAATGDAARSASVFVDGNAAAEAAEIARIDELAKSMKAADEATMNLGTAQRAQAAFTTEQMAAIDALHTSTVAQTASAEENAAAIAIQKANLATLLGQIDPTVKKLEQLDAAQAQLAAAQKAGLIGADDYAAYSAILDKSRSSIAGVSSEFSKLNFNTAQARREYGFMVKDIATGQWGRLTQSTATLANNVGIMGLAFSATGAAILSVVAVAALATYALIDQAKAWDQLNISVAKGDGIAGGVKQLSALTTALGSGSGSSIDAARTAVDSLAASGLLFGTNFDLAAKAATDWASVSGEAATTVTDKFTAIAKDPMAAILDGTVKVTAAQYDQIDAMLKVGDTQAAVNATIKIYFDQIENRSAMVSQNLSGWSELWINIRDVTQGATAGVGTYFDTLLHGIANINKLPRSQNWGYIPSVTSLLASPVQTLGVLGAASKAQNSQIQWNTGASTDATPPSTLTVAQLKIQTDIEKALDDSGTAAQKYASQVKLLNGQLNALNTTQLQSLQISKNDSGQYSGEGYQKLLTSMHKKSGLDKKVSTAPDVDSVKRDAQDQQAQIAATTQFIQGQYELRQYSMEDYYTEMKAAAQDSAAVEINSLNKQIAIEQTHGNNQQKIAALESQISTARQQESNKEAQLDIQAAIAEHTRVLAVQAYAQAQDDATKSLERQLTAETQRAGMGAAEYEQAQKITALYDQQSDALEKINTAYENSGKGAGDLATKTDESNKVIEQTAQRVNDVTAAYATLNKQQLDVTNGMKSSWADFEHNSLQLSDNMVSVWTDGLSSIGEAAAKTATGVGTSFDDMAKSMEATAIKALTNAAVTKFIQMVSGILGYDASGGAGAASYNSMGGVSHVAFNAKGGTYNSPSLSAHLNSVVSSPTLFKFAKGGALGMMGEAGNEAIMPLSRDSNGVLGVKAGGSSGMPVVNVNIQNAPASADVQSRPNGKGGVDIDVIFAQVDQYMAGGIASGTSMTSRAISQRNGR